jgi:hypothetical protein
MCQYRAVQGRTGDGLESSVDSTHRLRQEIGTERFNCRIRQVTSLGLTIYRRAPVLRAFLTLPVVVMC